MIAGWLKAWRRSNILFVVIKIALPRSFRAACKLSGVQGDREVSPLFAAAVAGLTAMAASVDVCTLWHQQAIRVKEPVEQRGSPALGSRVTPAANETLADLGLCGCVD